MGERLETMSAWKTGPGTDKLLTLGHELGNSLEVCNRDQGEQRYEDQEVDLRRRRSQGIDIVPVGNCCVLLAKSSSVAHFRDRLYSKEPYHMPTGRE